MLIYFLSGATYGFAAAVQPGPYTAYLVSESIGRGWRRTLPATLAPLITDGPIALVALTVLARFPAGMLRSLRLVGGGFVLYLAWEAWKAWRRPGSDGPPPRSPRSLGLLKAAAVNWMNPGPYLGWSLVLGPLFLRGWRENHSFGIAVLLGFYGTMVATLAGIVLLFSAAGTVGPKVNRALVGFSAMGLAAFGGYLLAVGIFAA